MRKKSSNSSLRAGFSLFEILLVLAMIAIILASALPRFATHETLCLHELRAKLSKANHAFMRLYTQSILQSQKPLIEPILQELTTQENQSCFFAYKKGKLSAKIGRQTLNFEIVPNDFRAKPKIYCSLSNALCRAFWQRTLKK